jgi:hypothetical protein
VFGASRHANDDRLIRRYMAERGWRALASREKRVVRHLAECGACAARYQALMVSLDEAAAESARQAEAAFSPERLGHQHDRILRRIDAHGQRARVLPFPVSSASPGVAGMRSRPMLHWVAAAAVVGLMIGLGTGRMIDPRRLADSGPRPAPQVASALPAQRISPVMRPGFRDSVVSEEEFLSELDDAVAGPRTPELETIGSLTLPASSGAIVPITLRH